MPILLLLALLLLILWIGGFAFFSSLGFIIHVLLVLAIILLIWHFVRPITWGGGGGTGTV